MLDRFETSEELSEKLTNSSTRATERVGHAALVGSKITAGFIGVWVAG